MELNKPSDSQVKLFVNLQQLNTKQLRTQSIDMLYLQWLNQSLQELRWLDLEGRLKVDILI